MARVLWGGGGHGGLAVALLFGAMALPASAQTPPPVTPPPVATPVPTTQDSVVRRDTIQPPLAHAPVPLPRAPRESRWHWDRAGLFASGALTLADLLDRVPGVGASRVGWMAQPMQAGVAGDFRRVRVFLDNVPMESLDPRAGGVLDLTQIALWAMEDVTIERRGADVVVHLRSWRVHRTSPYTRTDIATGDVQTNLYSFFYGDRGTHGQALQFGAQQFGTAPPDFLGLSSDQTGVFLRGGWASSTLSIDAFAMRVSRHRGLTLMDVTDDSIPGAESARTDAYLRVARGDPDTSRAWGQAMLVSSVYKFEGVRPPDIADSVVVDSDSSRSQSQLILSAGANRGAAGVTLTARVRQRDGRQMITPELRGRYSRGPAAGSAWIEGKGPDSLSRIGAAVDVSPAERLRLSGAVDRIDDRSEGHPSGTMSARLELGGLWRALWFTGGVIRRDSALLIAPAVLNLGAPAIADGPATGFTGAVEGHLWKSVYADISAIRWNDSAGLYRPQYQTRSELALRTTLPQRFPTGNFGFALSAVHEYRSSAYFPTATGVNRGAGYRTISTLMEIRINSAVVSWQFRNLRGEPAHQVPGFRMPRQTNFYGVRWEFWN
jgi:hypothetical protein